MGESECECLLSEPVSNDEVPGGVRGLEDEDDASGIPGVDDDDIDGMEDEDGKRLGLSVTDSTDQRIRSAKTLRLRPKSVIERQSKKRRRTEYIWDKVPITESTEQSYTISRPMTLTQWGVSSPIQQDNTHKRVLTDHGNGPT